MHYINPIAIFGPSFRAPLDPQIVLRQRKKLLAELELSSNNTIGINGHSFTKEELLAWFDELNQPNVAGYHTAITEDPALQKFLQGSANHAYTGIDVAAIYNNAATIYNDPAFIAWLGPYFYSACTKRVTDSLEHENPREMRSIFQNTPLMTPAQSEQLWLFITRILEKNIALFEHYKNRTQPHSQQMMPLPRITPFLGRDYLDVIKELPDNRFAGWKDKYAMSIQYPALAVTPNVKEILDAKATQLEAVSRKWKKKQTRNAILYGLIGIVIIALILRFWPAGK